MAYSRSLGLLRRVLGPTIDLEALWNEHLMYEFGTKDPDATINTMVEDCYVNHVPNMTGGVGRKYLHRFYKHHFIPRTPDVEMIPVSRTIGTDRIVDEFVSIFTHDREIDWFLPGVPPTGKRVEIATVSIVCFRGRKLYHEHIYWDQASVLVQLGLLDPSKLPVAGRESAQKVLDETRPSNELIPGWENSSGLD
jgi:carboxymethylenebutenolidase